MKTLLKILSIGFFVVIAGCGGGGSSVEFPENPDPPPTEGPQPVERAGAETAPSATVD